MNVALIGFMATGKSTVGRMLADRLGYMFVDTDEEIVRRTGLEIAEIFAVDGEKAFRAIEKKVVQGISGDGTVIACGGGVALNEDNVEALRKTSRLVLLTASEEKILGRVQGDDTRPLLKTEGPEQAVIKLLEERTPVYLRVADLVIDTSRLTPPQVAERIIHWMEVI